MKIWGYERVFLTVVMGEVTVYEGMFYYPPGGRKKGPKPK